MRLHVLGLPHTKFTDEFSWCAYTQKARRFIEMMSGPDFEIMAYEGWGEGSSDNIPEFNWEHPLWMKFNTECIERIGESIQPGDYICVIAGWTQKIVTDAFPANTAVEYGVGYGGVYTDFRVFESYAWMHTVYGALAKDAHAADGRFYDVVIPNSYHPHEFEKGNGSGDYLLFIGRGVERKGINLAREVAQAANIELVEVGQDTRGPVVGPEEKKELYKNARATIVPTLYIEPFGGVHVESQLCGTPVITTDWGVFTETVQQGFNGWRCRDLGEFVWAVQNSQSMDREAIVEHALSKWSTDVTKRQYANYFARLEDLKEKGWYTMRGQRPGGG